MERKRILVIVGSLRKQSFNRQLAQQAAALLEPHAHISWLYYADIPYMNQDIEFPTPESVRRVRNEVAAADGVLMASPEYNHSIPGVLKNLLDWLSRPVDAGQPNVVAGKPVTYCSAAGSSRASYLFADLAPVLQLVGMKVLDSGACTPTAASLDRQAFTTNVLSLSSKDRAALEAQCSSFLAALEE